MNKIDIEKKYKILNKYEEEIQNKGKKIILGIDEVGRGPLAGDVVIGGVVLDQNNPIYELNDSKKLTEKKRLYLDAEIKKKALFYEITSINNSTIDKIGINNAITLGVNKLIENISKKTNIDFILIDYMKIDLHQEHLILKKGDQISNSIAAASIIAKVFRDTAMIELGKTYPKYYFEKHKGYGTKKHIEAINKYGVIQNVHRKSFEPIKSIIQKGIND